MVRRKVYRNKPTASGKPTRYNLWVDIGDSQRRRKPRRAKNPVDQVFTTITTWLRAVGGGAKRKTTSRRRGRSTSDVHPNLYRRHASEPRRTVDEVARARQRRRNRGKR